MNLLELAEKCERDEPTWQLSEEVLTALGFQSEPKGIWVHPTRRPTMPLGNAHVTGSLDAAAELCQLHGVGWMLRNYYMGMGTWVCEAEVRITGTDMRGGSSSEWARNAQVLCAALLRALAESAGNHSQSRPNNEAPREK